MALHHRCAGPLLSCVRGRLAPRVSSRRSRSCTGRANATCSRWADSRCSSRLACAATAAAPACADARCVCAGCRSLEPRLAAALADLDAGPEHDLVGDQRHPHDAQIVTRNLQIGLPVGHRIGEITPSTSTRPLRASTSKRLGYNAMTRLQSNAHTKKANGARRREAAGRTAGETSVCGGFSGAAYAGYARCRRRLADSAGFEPAKHEAIMLARLASGCLGRSANHPGWEKSPAGMGRAFRYSDYTRQRNTEPGQGSKRRLRPARPWLGVRQQFQNVPRPIGAVDVPRAGHFAARPPVLQSLPLTATPVFSLTHRAASDWVRVMCMRPARRRYSNRTRFRSSHAPHSGHTAYRAEWAA